MKRTPELLAELHKRRSLRRILAQRSLAGQCLNCGKSDWVDAVDNHGCTYKGCNNCTLVLRLWTAEQRTRNCKTLRDLQEKRGAK